MQQFLQWMRARQIYLRAALAFAVAIGLILAAPKPTAYASSVRFACVIALFATLGGALVVLTRLARTAKEAKLRFAHHDGSLAQKDTVRFMLTERVLARRGVVEALLVALVATGLHVLSFWPQASVLAPVRGASTLTALLAFLVTLALPLAHRRSWIDILYLRRYLKLQAAHVQYRPKSARDGRRLAASLAPSSASSPDPKPSLLIEDMTKNVIIFGQPGSGKTACVLNTLLAALVSAKVNDLALGGLVLDIKGDFALVSDVPAKKGDPSSKLQRLCTAHGRDEDLYVFGAADWAEHPRTRRAIAYNFLDNQLPALEIAAAIMACGKLAGVESKESFFLDLARILLMHLIVLLRAASESDDPPSLIDLYRLATEPVSEQRGSLYSAVCDQIADRWPNPADMPNELQDAFDYVEQQHRKMPEKQLAGVVSSIVQTLSELVTEPIRAMISGKSTISIADAVAQGIILYIHMPQAERPRLALLVNTLFKMEFQNVVRRRLDPLRHSFLVADEFSNLYVQSEDGRGDSDFFSLSRQSNHVNVIAVQNLSSFLKKTRNKEDTHNLIGCCAVKIFLRNTDPDTNEFASKLFGERQEIIVSKSEHARFDNPFTRNDTNYSLSGKSVRIFPVAIFPDLEVPIKSDPRRHYTQSLIHLASRGETEHRMVFWKVRPL